MMRQFSFLSGLGLCPYADALSFVGFSVIFVKSSFVLRVCGFCGEADCFHPQVIDAHSSLVLTLQYSVAIDIETHSSLVLTLQYSVAIDIETHSSLVLTRCCN